MSDLNHLVNRLLVDHFPFVWVQGEISNLARPSSGHLYFTLKDDAAQVRCAMFRTHNRKLNFVADNGMQVIAYAKVGLYETRGDFQLVVEKMEESGDGALRKAFEQLKQKLFAEGLFDQKHKQSIPQISRHIGVITSPTGAAVRDIISVLKRRFPLAVVTVFPVLVQGSEAPQQICAMLDKVCSEHMVDVILLCRGGGSLEDLWAFNDEGVARAIYHCSIPIVTGIGHEIDFTIADFVADQRAPTPSAAAELICLHQEELIATLTNLENRLMYLINTTLKQQVQNLQWLKKQLQHPGQKLILLNQRLDELEQRLKYALTTYLNHQQAKIATITARIHQHSPTHHLKQIKIENLALHKRLITSMLGSLQGHRQALLNLTRALDAVSPLATLNRGYSITYLLPQQTLVVSDTQIKLGDLLITRLAKGRITSRVEKLQDD